MAHDFGRILQALQVMHQFDNAIGSGGIERLRREGDAVAEFRLEHIPALIYILRVQHLELKLPKRIVGSGELHNRGSG